VSVDTTRALLVCNGTRDAAGYQSGMHILSIANPEAPVELARWPADPLATPADTYVHDCVMAGNRLYAAAIYIGTERVVDLTNPANPTQIASWTYPGAYYTHNSWPGASGRWLYVTDEQNGQRLRIFDIADLAHPVLVNGITSNPQSIVHNAHVRGNELYLSNYTEGVRVLDLTDPAHPAEFAWADSYPGVSGGYGGVWEVCPFFPSGTVIASDMQTGLYVYRPVRNYGLLRVRVVDWQGQPVAGRAVYLTSQGDSLETPADGVVQFAPSPGTHTVLARAFGCYDATASRTVSLGSRDTVTLVSVPRATGSLAGTVRDAVSGLPLGDAQVTLLYSPLHAHSDAQGHYRIAEVPTDEYRIEARRAGYQPFVLDRGVGLGYPGQDFALKPARAWDALEAPSGWSVGAPGDDANSGVWTRVIPLGTGPPPPAEGPAPVPAHAAGPAGAAVPTPPAGAVLRSASAGARGTMRPLHEEPASASWGNAAPYADHSPGADSACFVTGQGTNPADPEEADVDVGRTTLTSPPLDLTGMVRPTIGYWRWFYSWSPVTGQPDPADWLQVLISGDGGQTWVPVEVTTGWHNDWEERAIAVADYVAPSAQVRLRFVAADLGDATIVEAGVDDITTYDAYPGPADVAGVGASLHFRPPWPNPASGSVGLVIETPVAGPLEVAIVDVAGRRVRELYRGAAPAGPIELRWDGRDDGGIPAAAGLYFARARAAGRESAARLVRVR